MTAQAQQLGPACREAQDGLVYDPVGLERITQHRRRCPDCQRAAEQIAEVRSAVIAGGGLDEVARRRIRQRLAAQVDGLATLNAQLTRRQWWPWMAAAAVLLLVLSAVVAVDRLTPDRLTPAPDGPTAKQGSQPPAPQRTARLRPEGQTRTVSVLDLTAGAVRADVLVPSGVHAKERQPMTLRASITLQGPGRLSVVESGLRPEGTVRLERGLLLARVQPSTRAAAFRVLARGYCVEVKGTVFAVDARGDQLRVVVTRGAVAVRSEGAAPHAGVMVRAGQGWQPTEGIKPATAALVALLEPAATRVVPQPDPTPPRGRPALTDVERLYRRAEAAMRGGRAAEAARLLAQLTRRHPRHALATAALYELADRSYRAGDPLRARVYLKRLLAQRGGDRSLRDPAHHLICRIEVEARRVDQAITCLRAFRAAHPRSPHAAESLHTLAGLLHGKGGCRAALALWRRYLADYPRGAHTKRIRARLAACR
jgi:TolA-binding protein